MLSLHDLVLHFTVTFVVLRRMDTIMITVDEYLHGTPPSRVVFGSAIVSYIGLKFVSAGMDIYCQLRHRGVLRVFFEALSLYPFSKSSLRVKKRS